MPAVPASCALDESGQREQHARYARLAKSVERVDRKPDAVVVRFDTSLDGATLESALAVERECCPFFRFTFEPARRELRATVAEAAALPALAAVADWFGAEAQPAGA